MGALKKVSVILTTFNAAEEFGLDFRFMNEISSFPAKIRPGGVLGAWL